MQLAEHNTNYEQYTITLTKKVFFTTLFGRLKQTLDTYLLCLRNLRGAQNHRLNVGQFGKT